MLLALDISTSIIGWSLWDGKKLKDQGFVKLKDSKGDPKELHDRLDNALNYFIKWERSHDKVTRIAAEEAIQKFSSGKTTAVTMNKLIAMNFGLTYNLSRMWSAPVEYISVNEARKRCGIKIPKCPPGQKKGKDWAKNFVVEAIAKKYPMVTIEKTKSGNIKSGFDDLADAIVIGEAVLLG